MASSPMRYIIMSKQGFEHPDLKNAEFQRAAKPVALRARVRGLGSPSMRVLELDWREWPEARHDDAGRRA